MGRIKDSIGKAMSAIGFQSKADETNLPTTEKAYSDATSLVSSFSPTYNPDDLIGKKGYKVYKRMMLDEQVKAVVRFKRGAITARSYFFELDTEELSDEERLRRIELFETILKRMKGSFEDVLNGVMSSMYNGFSLTEKVYNIIEYDGLNWWGIKKLRLKPFDTFYFDTDAKGELKRLVQFVDGDELKLDIKNFIHFTHNNDVDEYYGQSELREVYRSYFSKDVILRLENIYLERFASGFNWITPPTDRTIREGSTEHTQIMNVLNNMQAGTGILLPSGFTLNNVQPRDTQAFRNAIQYHDLEIAKGLLVPNLLGLSNQGGTGSYGQSQTQLEAFLWNLDSDAERLEEAMNEQLFMELGDANFGDGIYPRFRLKPLSKSQLYDLVSRWQDLVSSGAVERSDSDEEHIRNLLEFPDKALDEPPEPPEPGEDPPQVPGGENPPPDEPGSAPEANPPAPPDETIRGKGLVSVSAFSRALKRVDFAVIQRTSEEREEEHAGKMAGVMDDMLGDLINRATDHLEAQDTEAVAAIRFDAGKKRKLRNEVRLMLQEGWAIGQRHAADEIDKARGEAFSANFSRTKMQFVSQEFFDIKSFTIAGNLSDDILAKIRNTLLGAIKTSKTTQEAKQLIIELAISEGVISREFAEQELGRLIDAEANPTARLNNIVRTNTFESINEARYSYFTDPQQDGFVDALEYSAILDSRTTNICQHLDGRTYSVDSEVWDRYRPPNHFQCRSLLIPVTKADEWTEDDYPSVEPQRGFK